MASFKELEHKGWAEKARFYDDYFAGVTRQAIEPLLENLGGVTGRRLIDVCCGTGDLAEAAAQAGAQVTGVDFAEPMIEIARARVPGANFEVGDAENLNFENASFDVVTCAFGLWHVGEPDMAIASRKALLDRVATDGHRVLGYHFAYPGIGNIEKASEGYRFTSS